MPFYWGMDNKIKTPYSYTLDLSVGRDLGHNLSLEVSYVGRLSHRLLTQFDVSSPLDLVDPKNGSRLLHGCQGSCETSIARVFRQGA